MGRTGGKNRVVVEGVRGGKTVLEVQGLLVLIVVCTLLGNYCPADCEFQRHRTFLSTIFFLLRVNYLLNSRKNNIPTLYNEVCGSYPTEKL